MRTEIKRNRKGMHGIRLEIERCNIQYLSKLMLAILLLLCQDRHHPNFSKVALAHGGMDGFSFTQSYPHVILGRLYSIDT